MDKDGQNDARDAINLRNGSIVEIPEGESLPENHKWVADVQKEWDKWAPIVKEAHRKARETTEGGW